MLHQTSLSVSGINLDGTDVLRNRHTHGRSCGPRYPICPCHQPHVFSMSIAEVPNGWKLPRVPIAGATGSSWRSSARRSSCSSGVSPAASGSCCRRSSPAWRPIPGCCSSDHEDTKARRIAPCTREARGVYTSHACTAALAQSSLSSQSPTPCRLRSASSSASPADIRAH